MKLEINRNTIAILEQTIGVDVPEKFGVDIKPSPKLGLDVKPSSLAPGIGVDVDTKIKVGVTSVHSQDANDSELLRRPDLSANIGVEHDVNNKLTLWYDWNYYGEHKDLNPTTYATVLREEQHTTDVGVKYQLSANSTITGTVNNITDLEYSRPMGYTQPGREYSVSVKYLF